MATRMIECGETAWFEKNITPNAVIALGVMLCCVREDRYETSMVEKKDTEPAGCELGILGCDSALLSGDSIVKKSSELYVNVVCKTMCEVIEVFCIGVCITNPTCVF